MALEKIRADWLIVLEVVVSTIVMANIILKGYLITGVQLSYLYSEGFVLDRGCDPRMHDL